MSIVLIAVVQTVVVSIADVNPWNAVAIVAREQITEARSTLRLAVFWRFICAVAAIVVSVAIPSGRNTPMVGASETVLRTSTLSTV